MLLLFAACRLVNNTFKKYQRYSMLVSKVSPIPTEILKFTSILDSDSMIAILILTAILLISLPLYVL